MSTAIPRTMRAAVTYDWGKLRVDEIPVPELGPGEVLCRVKACGVCGTDPHILKGELRSFGWPPGLPFVQGHEWTGEVVAVGPGVDGFKLGDRVAGETTKGCMTCDFCRHGRYNLCLNFGKRDKGYILYGHDTYGAFCEYVARPPVTLHKLPDSVTDEEAVMLSQVIIALHTVERPGVRPTDVTLTIGPGTIGLLTFQIARAFGCARTLVMGRGYRLEMAKRLGADAVIDITTGDPVKQVEELTGGRGADVVYEVSGSTQGVEWAFQCAAMGGRVALCGIVGNNQTIPVVTDRVALREVDVFGIRGGPHCYPPSIQLLAQKRISAHDLVTHKFPFEKIHDAFDVVLNRKDGVLKAAITP